MARPEGLDHFCNSLKGLEAQYVIIGGGAAAVLLEEQGLTFRATKDVDLVILTNTSKELNARISEYVHEGKYKTREATKDEPRYYRFSDPIPDKGYPAIVEVFARNEQAIELKEGQYIIPVEKSINGQLSAILLDDEYFGLIKANIAKSSGGIQYINGIANICLKARAHRELSDRKAKGDPTVQDKDIKKHIKDIFRMAVTLTGQEKQPLGDSAKNDLQIALIKLIAIPPKEFKQFMGDYPGANSQKLIDLIKIVFGL